MEFLDHSIAWANANEGLLQAVGLLAMAAGVLLSPVGTWARNRLTGQRAPEGAEPEPPGTPEPAPAGQDRASIAVLPFEVVPDDPEHEYLADGLVEDLVTLLARIPGFFVIARQSTLAYRGREVDVRQIGRELGVRYVLQGTLRSSGDRLRLGAHLIETEHGTHVWTGRLDRHADELSRIEDEVAGAVAAELEPELIRAEAELVRRRPPSDWDAWSYYKQAQARLMLGGWHEDTFEEGASLLRQAIALDPDFGLAHAQLSLLLAFGRRIGLHIDRDAAKSEAIAEGERALALEGHRSEVQGLVGCALADVGHPDRGIPILERAVAVNPSNAQAWVALGAARLTIGEVEQGVADLKHGLEISPQDSRIAVWGGLYAAGLAQLGRLEEAREAAREACRGDPRSHLPRVILTLILALLDQPEEALAALREARKVRPQLDMSEIEILVSPFAGSVHGLWERLEARESPVDEPTSAGG